MEVFNTQVDGIYIIKKYFYEDIRGNFVKVFNKEIKEKFNFEIEEIFYSYSYKNVLRGMHFQIPPYEQKKLIFLVKGEIFDVVVDLRKNSKYYGKSFSFILKEKENNAILISEGFAHGFYVKSEDALLVYCMTKGYAPLYDKGILWNSIDIKWPTDNPIISERDKSFCKLNEFISPF